MKYVHNRPIQPHYPARESQLKAKLSRVVIAETHVLLRDSLARLLTNVSPPFRDIVLADSVSEAIRACREDAVDLLVLRLGLIGCEDEVALARMRKEIRGIKILVYAGPAASDERILRAIRNGVDGVIEKSNCVSDFLEAIRRLREGHVFFPIQSNRLLVQIACGFKGSKAGSEQLSPRERELLGLIAAGKTNKEMAENLGLRLATVATHRRNLMSKTGAHNAADLIRYAHDRDLLTLSGRL